MKTRNTSSEHQSTKANNRVLPTFYRKGKKLCQGTITLLTIILIAFVPITSSAQNGDPPPPPSEHGQNGNQVPGGGAPIGDGLLMLLAMGTVYGLRKRITGKKKQIA